MKQYQAYRPVPMTAGASYVVKGQRIAGFLCTTTGTLTVTDADGTVLVNAIAVTAGQFLELPLFFNTSMGGTVALTTAAGTLLV